MLLSCCCVAAVGLAPLIGTTCKYLVSQPVFGPQQSRKIENAKLSAKQMKYNTKKVAESETERARERERERLLKRQPATSCRQARSSSAGNWNAILHRSCGLFIVNAGGGRGEGEGEGGVVSFSFHSRLTALPAAAAAAAARAATTILAA